MSKTQPEKANKSQSQSERRQATRQAILAASKQVLMESGFEQAKTQAIAKLAGVAEGTVFLHFENKQGLLRALIDDFFIRLQKNAESIVQKHEPGADRLKALSHNYIVWLERDWPLARLVIGSQARYGDTETRACVDKHNQRYTEMYMAEFRHMQSLGQLKLLPLQILRDSLFGAIEHHAIANFHTGRSSHSEQFLDELWQLLLHGAQTPATEEASLQRVDAKLDHIINTLEQQNSGE